MSAQKSDAGVSKYVGPGYMRVRDCEYIWLGQMVCYNSVPKPGKFFKAS